MTQQHVDTTRDAADIANRRQMRRRALFGAAAGTFIEFYDFALYGFTIAVLAPQFFPADSQAASILLAFVAYGVGFITRPLGGLFFGALGDRIGRKQTLVIVLLLVGLATAAVGLLPTYQQIGILAPILFCLLRLIQGFSAGGEVSGATSFVLEHAPSKRKGFYIAIIPAMSGLPSVVAILLVLGLSSAMGDQAFQEWGWRIPFLLALPLSAIGWYIRNKTEESLPFVNAKQRRTGKARPLLNAFRQHKKAMAFVFAFCALSSLGFYLIVGYFTTYLEVVVGLSQGQSLVVNCIALCLFTLTLPFFGRISDRFGRRAMLRIGALSLAVVAVPALLLANTGSLALASVGVGIIVVAQCVFQSGQFAFLVEIFPTSSRFSGSAIAYNVAYAVLGGTAPIVSSFLVSATGINVAPGFYLAGVALIVFVVALFAPETRDLNVDR